MSNQMTIDQAAQLATDVLSEQHLSPTYQLRSDDPPTVAPGCIASLVDMHRLTHSTVPGMVDATEVKELFSRTRVLTGTGLSVLRVSIGPLRPSGPCDSLPDGRKRRWAGWDFDNVAGLDDLEAWAGVAGVWPLAEETARSAWRAVFAPSVKGFVDGSLVRRVTGYYLDMTTRRRWIETEPYDDETRRHIFSKNQSGREWEHLWLSIPRGPVAEFTARI